MLKTFRFIEEIGDTNSQPVKFLCGSAGSGGAYYIKFGCSVAEYDELLSEVVCQNLLRALRLSTPELAFVSVEDGSFSAGEIHRNAHRIEPGVIGLGSKEIPYHLLPNQYPVLKKKDFRRIPNPEAIIHLSMFDLLVGNKDRHGKNYNLLIESKTMRLFAIDHCYAFPKGIAGINPDQTLIRTDFCLPILKYLTKDQILNEAEKFLYLWKSSDFSVIISQSLTGLPESWKFSPEIKERLECYLLDERRLLDVQQLFTDTVLKIKSSIK